MFSETCNFRLAGYVPRLIRAANNPAIKLNIHQLDWNRVDNYKRTNWLTRTAKDASANISMPETLPAVYETAIANLHYAIPITYLREINRLTMLFFTEHSYCRPFDTVIRDMCSQVGDAAIACAFGLLVDCLYDPVAGTWLHTVQCAAGPLSRQVIHSLLLYKFWRGLTGRGLVSSHAGLQEHYDTRTPEAMKVVQAIKDWEGDQEKHFEYNYVPAKDSLASEPSTEDKL